MSGFDVVVNATSTDGNITVNGNAVILVGDLFAFDG